MRSNFSIRSPHGFLLRQPGQLYIGGALAARSRSFDYLVKALCGHLAALASTPRPVEEPRVRAFSDGIRVVLTDLPRPGLVNDDVLARRGIHELHLWSPEFAEGPAVTLPHALTQLAGGQPEAIPPSRKVVGVVLSSESGALDHGYEWLHAMNRMGASPTPTNAADEVEARRSILALLE